MKYCLLGEKLGHSYSKEIHSFSGINYSLKEVEKNEIENFLKQDFDGFNVTIPYKKEIISYLDQLDQSASEIGSVNTVVRENGMLIGYNTDVFGMEYALNLAKITLCKKSVMILGSGGTSLTAKALCKKQGASKIITVSRNGEINYQNCYNQKVDVIINTTPVGMFPNFDGCPIDLERFSCVEGVFDCVYNPFRTGLILKAQEMNIKSIGGLAMLVAQALKAQEIWMGKNFSSIEFEQIYKFLIQKYGNIVLIGMPSAGKSTIGKLICEEIGKTFVDTDENIALLSGKTPEQIITTDGEDCFREIEKEVVLNCSKLSGAVIATGGGVVLKAENIKRLKKNGYIFYLERSVDKLIDNNRPLSKNGAISRLFKERAPIYESVCDKKVSNNGKIESVVKEILQSENFSY